MCFSLRLVNTYGNFGSITKTRGEVVLKGTAHQDPYAADSPWKEYGELCTVTAHPYPTHASLPQIILTQHNTTSARGFRFTSNCCTVHAATTCFSFFFCFFSGAGGGCWRACVFLFVFCLSGGGVCVCACPYRSLVRSSSLRLVNTYGAFGSVTKTRGEVVLKGTRHRDPRDGDAVWEEYGEYGRSSARAPTR